MRIGTLNGRALQLYAHMAGLATTGLERQDIVAALRKKMLVSMGKNDLRSVASEIGLDVIDIRGHVETDRIVKRIIRHFESAPDNRSVRPQPPPRPHSDAEASALQSSPPALEELRFKRGDRVLRKGEVCEIVAAEEGSLSYTVRMERDGRLIDTPQEGLLPANDAPVFLAAVHSDAETPVTQTSPPAFEELRFKRGDRVFRKGELCEVVAAEEASQSYTVRVVQDGRLIDTPQEHLLAERYPSRLVMEEDSCPICFRPVSGENCLRCCVKCEGSKFLHRQCLLGLMCQGTCPRGHPLVEKKQATSACFVCHRSRVGGIQWGCECGTVCRWCVEATLRSEVLCPTCRTPLPSNKTWIEPLFTRHGDMPASRPV